MAVVPYEGHAAAAPFRLTQPEGEATRLLYERHQRKILAFCQHPLRNREEAEDATQITFMNAFRGLANVSQATLANVAPGIAEALIATAIGLFAAIPAVVAYNRFTHDVDRLAVRFESFMEEFSNILQRQPQPRPAAAHETRA